MGCSASLQGYSEQKAHLLDVTSTVIFPLSMYQKSILKYTWVELDKSAVQFGNEIFYRLFCKHPEMKSLFPEFTFLQDFSDLKRMERLTGHPKKIITTVREAIESLDDAEVFISKLEALGEKHVENNLKPEYLSALGVAFNQAVETILGDVEYTNDVKRAWNDLYNFICKLMKSGLAKRLLADSKKRVVVL